MLLQCVSAFCLVVLPISLTQTLCPSCKRLSKLYLVDLWKWDSAQSHVTNLEHLWDIFKCRLCHGRQHRAPVFVVFVLAVVYGIRNRNFPSQISDNHTRGRLRRYRTTKTEQCARSDCSKMTKIWPMTGPQHGYRFNGLVVMISVSHTGGPRFDPGLNQFFIPCAIEHVPSIDRRPSIMKISVWLYYCCPS